MILAIIVCVSLPVGYMCQVIIDRLRVARQAAEHQGLDTSVDKTVMIVPNYKPPWPVPNPLTAIYAILTGVLLVVFRVSFESLPTWGVLFVVGSVPFLTLLLVIDSAAYRLPFPLTFGLLSWQAASLVGLGVSSGNWNSLKYAFFGALAYAGFLMLIFVVSGGNLGFGDVVLGVPLGVLLGATAPDAFVAAGNALYGLLLGSALMVGGFIISHIRRSLEGKREGVEPSGRQFAPFGPNLIVGAWLFLLLAAG